MKLRDLEVAVRPGTGLVSRYPTGLLVVTSADPADTALVGRLLDACRSAHVGASGAHGDGAPSPLAARLRSLLSEPASTSALSFCVVVDGDDGLSIFGHGSAEVAITGGGPTVNLGDGRGDLWSASLQGLPTALSIGPRGPGSAAEALLDLVEGTVPGAGAVLTPRRPEGAPALLAGAPSMHAPPVGEFATRAHHGDALPAVAVGAGPATLEPATLEPAQPVAAQPVAAEPVAVMAAPASAPAEPVAAARPGVPASVMVWGVNCKRGHFNHPDARYCRLCGVQMVNQRRDPVLGPRPVIGYLVLEDGSTFKVDTNYVLGSQPDEDPMVKDNTARGLMISDDSEGSVSPVHALIQLDEWELMVTDKRSRYGTHVWAPGDTGWTRLPPEVPSRLEPRSHLLLGARRLVFEPVSKK